MTRQEVYLLADLHKLREELKVEHYGRLANLEYIHELEEKNEWLRLLSMVPSLVKADEEDTLG